MIGICGDNCSFCPRYVATENGGAGELEKVKELWVRLGLRDPDSPVEEMACHGCKPENKCAYSELRACTYERGVGNCGLCHEYPCGLILDAFEKSDKLHSHASRVCTPKEMGVIRKAFFFKRQNLDRIHFEKDKGKSMET